MEGLLQYISLVIIYAIIAYGGGVAMRYSSDLRFMFGGIVGFVCLGLIMCVGFLGSKVHISPMISIFLWTAAGAGPLGYVTAPLIMGRLEAKSARVLGSKGFDKTYRKYTQKRARKQNDGFRWYDAKDFHEQRERAQRRSETYDERKADNRYHTYSQSRRQSAPPESWMSETDKRFKIMGLAGTQPDAAQIKSAYRKLARKYHPDVLASQDLSEAKLDKAMKRMQEINVAYDWLKDNGHA